MKKQKNTILTPSAKKAKRRKAWGTVCLVLATILLVDGIVIGIALHERDVLFPLVVEGLILLGIGILLRRRAGRIAGETAEADAKDASAVPPAETKREEAVVRYKVKDIFDEELRREIYSSLDTFSRIYKNFFGESDITAARLSAGAVLFENPETEIDKTTWLNTAAFLSQTAKMELAANCKDTFVSKGERAILDFFADK